MLGADLGNGAMSPESRSLRDISLRPKGTRISRVVSWKPTMKGKERCFDKKIKFEVSNLSR